MPTAHIDLFPKISKLFEQRAFQKPAHISAPESEGLFNHLYFVTLPSTPAGFTCNEFFVRLSHPSHPFVKTRNEVGWLQYFHQHAPPSFNKRIPKLLFFSDTTNELGHEYTVIERLPGETLCDIWEDIEPSTLVTAVVDVVQEIRSLTSKLPQRWFGGFTPEFKPGPYVECTTYSLSHIKQHWSTYPDETYETLNLTTPFNSLAEYWKARISRDIRIIEKHKHCEELRTKYLEKLKALPDIPESIHNAKPFLAHRDLVLGNLLWDRKIQKITGILDWEFAGMYPLADWNPGNTLWTTKQQKKKDGKVTQGILFSLLDKELKARGLDDTDQIFRKGTVEYQYARVVNLSYWVVRKHLEQEELEEDGRVGVWLQEFYHHTNALCTRF
ncbi:hypothetical protein TWF102_007673 [Orbilia oligospora]|uniref:Aminoglycoside phosphotransferase domain-containing protein n=1 Tax=Orbilia oligospora TaxID=2813651 RepID=A0A7C8J4M2_ORBOL|nr:hypothetical protein TWF706_009653 [Orbilia oligospora]KAF3094167.1 hypothetical protein TWF102_007673 [Orbilia oligospora]KAF3138714.1 hypothetical protein TWF594_006905 [Orbilia oligospora]